MWNFHKWKFSQPARDSHFPCHHSFDVISQHFTHHCFQITLKNWILTARFYIYLINRPFSPSKKTTYPALFRAWWPLTRSSLCEVSLMEDLGKSQGGEECDKAVFGMFCLVLNIIFQKFFATISWANNSASSLACVPMPRVLPKNLEKIVVIRKSQGGSKSVIFWCFFAQ